jgi:hypothetical protein
MAGLTVVGRNGSGKFSLRRWKDDQDGTLLRYDQFGHSFLSGWIRVRLPRRNAA